jgi:hypothetical protein
VARRKEGRVKNKSILLWLEDKHDQFTIHTDSIREQQQEQHVLPQSIPHPHHSLVKLKHSFILMY